MAMDMQVLAGLVEHQTLGQVIPAPVSERVPTKVDAALITPFMEDALMRFVRMLGEEGGAALLASALQVWCHDHGHAHALFGDDGAGLPHVCFGRDGGQRQKSGTMALIFPDIEVLTAESEDDALSNVEKFQSTVKQATTTLNVVIGRVKMPISAVQGLQVGEMLHCQTIQWPLPSWNLWPGSRWQR